MTKPYAIGIDVGGTKLAAGLVSRDGTILHRYSTQAHSEKEPEFVIEAIEQTYHAIIEQSQINPSEIEAIGLGFPGNVNGPEGIVLVSSNLPAWDHFPLRDTVAERLGVPVILENDTNLCAVGEHRYGAGRGVRDMCYVTISTGYGIGIIINNQLYVGHTGTAGELAHVVVKPRGPRCTCGKLGCLMAYASGVGISRMAYEKIEEGAETVLRDMMPPNGQRFSGQVIVEAAKQGDGVAQDILKVAGEYCGIGLSIVIQLFNPELIVIGGGLTHIGKMLEEPMIATMHENTQPELWNSINIKPWQLGNDLGILGAAAKVFTDAEVRERK